MNDYDSRLGTEALAALRRLRTMREFDADLDLLITAIGRYGSVDAVFL